MSAFAPATISNFGSGFDVFGAAFRVVSEHRGPASAKGTRIVEPLGDVVSVRRRKQRGVKVIEITGDEGELPRNARDNCAAAAAADMLRRAHAPFGLDLILDKGLPRCSGLGSSAASAAAGAYAAALALGSDILKPELLESALRGEFVSAGAWHGDNVWPSLLGGSAIICSTRPAEIVRIDSPRSLWWVTVHPDLKVPTRRARAVLPRRVPLGDAVAQAGRFGSLVAAWIHGDRAGIGASLTDRFAEPRRVRLVPGFKEARKAALRAGAHGMTLSGAGPAVIAVTPEGEEGSVAEAIQREFSRAGLASRAFVCAVDGDGAREVSG